MDLNYPLPLSIDDLLPLTIRSKPPIKIFVMISLALVSLPFVAACFMFAAYFGALSLETLWAIAISILILLGFYKWISKTDTYEMSPTSEGFEIQGEEAISVLWSDVNRWESQNLVLIVTEHSGARIRIPVSILVSYQSLLNDIFTEKCGPRSLGGLLGLAQRHFEKENGPTLR